MKLSIVIICWNDLNVIGDCLRSVFNQTTRIAFEVIISDNGSSDGSLDYIRKHFANVRIVENGQNLGFAKGNNAGINVANGEYVLILNPDTIIRERALEKLVSFADNRPEAGAFGCRVLNPDGSFQNPARPIPTVSGYLISALYLRWLGRLSPTICLRSLPRMGRTIRASHRVSIGLLHHVSPRYSEGTSIHLTSASFSTLRRAIYVTGFGGWDGLFFFVRMPKLRISVANLSAASLFDSPSKPTEAAIDSFINTMV